MKLTPEDFQKLETKELANIIRKLGEGKTLTKREEEKLQRARAGGDENASAARTNFAHTWDELARILTQRLGVSITRKSLQNWRNPRLFPQFAGRLPQPRPDGRHDVSEWMRFIFETGRHGADELLEPDEIDGDGPRSLRDWKEHREKLLCSKLEREIARGDNLLLVAADLEIPIGALLAAVQTRLSQFPPRVARFMVMKRDEHEAEEKLRDEIDAILRDLNFASYLDDSLGEILGEIPFDAETEKLFELVTFDGQDRQKLLELIERVARETLRRVGRCVVAESTEQRKSDLSEVLSEPDKKETADVATPKSSPVAVRTRPPRNKRSSTSAAKE